jgi:amino acid permease
MISRDELLGGLPARRASTLLFAIESRTARLLHESRQAVAPLLAGATAEAREHAFLAALAGGRDLPIQSTIQDLERYASQWAALVPPDPNLRAALARLLGEKYGFTARVAPALRRAVGMDDDAVQQAYQRLHGRPLTAIYAPRLTVREQVQWLSGRMAKALETLPPFWTAFALTLTETVGAGILALPIALAHVGPLAGVVLLVVLGLVNVLTIVAISEAVARNGSIRYGHAYFGRVVADYLGRVGSVILTVALLTFTCVISVVYYVGVSTTLASATGIRPMVWAALLFLVILFFLRRQSLDATVASALLIGAVNIGLLLILVALTLPHVRAANLLRVSLPFIGGRPFDPSILALIFGVVLVTFFGHLSVGNCARYVLRRDPSGRALIRGNAAAMITVIVLLCVWVLAINGAVAPAALAQQSGTALIPLATAIGPVAYPFGAVYVVLGMGMASIHYSLALYNQVREWLPVRPQSPRPQRPMPGIAGQVQAGVRRWDAWFWLGATPPVVIFLVIEWMLLSGRVSFARPLAFLGTLTVSLLGGIFPVLLLAASRRKGEYVPGTVFRLLSHPVLLAGVYLLLVTGILLHGLVIWQDPFERAAALLVGAIILGATAVIIQRGAFRSRAVVEMRVDRRADGQAVFNLVGHGRPMLTGIHLRYGTSEERLSTAHAAVAGFQALRSATFELPLGAPREIKVWAHQITPEGNSVPLSALLNVWGGSENASQTFDLAQSGGQVVVPFSVETSVVELSFPQPALVRQGPM